MLSFHAPRLHAHTAAIHDVVKMPAYQQIKFAYDHLKAVTYHGGKWAYVGKRRIYLKHYLAAKNVKRIQARRRAAIFGRTSAAFQEKIGFKPND